MDGEGHVLRWTQGWSVVTTPCSKRTFACKSLEYDRLNQQDNFMLHMLCKYSRNESVNGWMFGVIHLVDFDELDPLSLLPFFTLVRDLKSS